MSKTTLNLRIDDQIKKQAELVFENIGISMSSAIVLYLKTVIREQGIPFEIRLNKKEKNQRIEAKKTSENNESSEVFDGESLLQAINKL